MEAKEVLKRTWLDARKSVGVYPLSVFKCVIFPIAWFLGQIGNVLYVFNKHGKPDGITEIFLIAWPTGVFLAALMGVFLWNLWLAPYKILWEKLDTLSSKITDGVGKAESSQKQAILRDMEALLESETTMQFSGSTAVFEKAHSTSKILRLRHNAFFPKSLKIGEFENWIEKIVNTIQENPFEVADKKIKKAASKGSWEDI